MKNKNSALFFVLLFLVSIPIGALIYYSIGVLEGSKTPDYQSVIDSLNNENKKLDSLYDIEKNKREQTKILYKKISIKSELDSLGKLREDLSALRSEDKTIRDTMNSDSLRLILMKEFN